jgi:hypothetical protein
MRMARLLAQQRTSIEILVAANLEKSAAWCAQNAAETPLLNVPQANKLRQGMAALPALGNLGTSGLEFDRFQALDYILSLRQGGYQEGIPTKATTALILNVLPVNFDASLRRVNEFYDRVGLALSLPTYPQRRDALVPLIAETRRSSQSRAVPNLADLTLSQYAASFNNINMLVTEALVEDDLAQIALALRAAKASGEFPAVLNDLKLPDFTVPLDKFTLKPFIYKRDDDGYTLSSPGFHNDTASRRNFVEAPN